MVVPAVPVITGVSICGYCLIKKRQQRQEDREPLISDEQPVSLTAEEETAV